MTNDREQKARSARRKPGLAVDSFRSEVEIIANKDHIVAVFSIGHPRLNTLGVRFNSPEELMLLFLELMNKAAEVWPNDQYVKEFLE